MNFHGGNIYDYNSDIIDFSSNINPYGVSDSLKKEIFNRINEVSRYPDINYKKLKSNISEYLKVDVNDVIVGNGAIDIIYNSINVIYYENVYILAPTFSEYRKASEIFNKTYFEILSFDFDNGIFDLNYFSNKIERNSIVIICNPNNPTGFAIDNISLLNFCNNMKNKNCFVILDETFVEFTNNIDKYSMVRYYSNLDNILIIRAVTKFFGIPGIRLGYAVCSNSIIKNKLEYFSRPWDINTFAVIASDIIFKDKKYIELSYNWLETERIFLYNELSKFNIFKVYNTNSNYFLLKFYDLDSDIIQDRLLKHNILIRKNTGFTGLSKKFIRIAIKDNINNKKLINALRSEFI